MEDKDLQEDTAKEAVVEPQGSGGERTKGKQDVVKPREISPDAPQILAVLPRSDSDAASTNQVGNRAASQRADRSEEHSPTAADVLLGRGKPFQSHPGNLWMLQIVDDKRETYLQAERNGKHHIIEEVMGTIRNNGGRFLSRVEYENYWEEVSHSIAYRKVGHVFRSRVRGKARRAKESPRTASVSRQNTSRSSSLNHQAALMGSNPLLGVIVDRAQDLRPGLPIAPGAATPTLFVAVNPHVPILSPAFSIPGLPQPLLHRASFDGGLRPELSVLSRMRALDVANATASAYPFLSHQNLYGPIASMLSAGLVRNDCTLVDSLSLARAQMLEVLLRRRRHEGTEPQQGSASFPRQPPFF